jgi:hypothetical protein
VSRDNIHLLPHDTSIANPPALEGFVLSSCSMAGICPLYRKARATFTESPASLLTSRVTGLYLSLTGYSNVAVFRLSAKPRPTIWRISALFIAKPCG